MAPMKTSEVDLLIVGAGAAGTMAATCCAAYGLKAKIIDKRPAKILAGHADGITTRTAEILHSFGVGRTVEALGAPLRGPQFWHADSQGFLELQNRGKLWNWNAYNSQYTGYTLSQARLQDIMWDYIAGRSDLEVDRGVITERLEIKHGVENYPVHVTVRKAVNSLEKAKNGGDNVHNSIRLDDDDKILQMSQAASGEQELIKAKYVVACDGAHSWIRRQLNIPMVGDDIDVIWGVMDIHAITDFPDARLINYIVSREEQSGLLWIPREHGITRIYTVVAEAQTDEDGKFVRSSVSEQSIFEAVKKNMGQYKIDYSYCEWWAAYQIGQRVARDNIDPSGRIFLVGDAVHTHSPKAGQGMNVSMTDAHNLMWKLNLVVKGFAEPSILQTYRDERLGVAQRLVNFDRSLAAIASGKAPPPIPEGTISADDLMASAQTSASVFMRGLDVVHPPTRVMKSKPDAEKTAKTYFVEGRLPPGLTTGMRMPSHYVLAHADTDLHNIGDMLRSEGCKFRLFVFAGNLGQQSSRDRLDRLADAAQTLAIPKALLEIITIQSADRFALDNWLEQLPEICHPKLEDGRLDYYKLFYDHEMRDTNNTPITSAYDDFQVDRERGRLVLVRPDGFIACQTEVEDFETVKAYFDGFMNAPETNGASR